MAFVAVTAVDDGDRTTAIDRLARQMNRRIDGVLAGEIRVTPIPAPTPTPVPSGEGFNLPALLPTLEDLPEGATLANEGFVFDPATMGSYEREIGARGLVMALGSSRVMNISLTVELHGSTLDAKAPVLFLKALDPLVFGDLVGHGLAEAVGFTPENVTFDALDLPRIGDAAAGFLMKLETPIADFDAHMLFFARGPIAAQIVVMGPAGEVFMEDTIPVAKLIDERIIATQPPAVPQITPTLQPTATRIPAATPSPTSVPPLAPTPELHATVEALVQEQLQAILATTPTPEATPNSTLTPTTKRTPLPTSTPTQEPTPTPPLTGGGGCTPSAEGTTSVEASWLLFGLVLPGLALAGVRRRKR